MRLVESGAGEVVLIDIVKGLAQGKAFGRQEQQQYGQWWSQAEALAYYNLLKARYKVKITAAAPAKTPAN